MAQKTIPQLNEITSIDENAIIPVDTGIQSYKINAENLAKSLGNLTPQFKGIATIGNSYKANDYVYVPSGALQGLLVKFLQDVPSYSLTLTRNQIQTVETLEKIVLDSRAWFTQSGSSLADTTLEATFAASNNSIFQNALIPAGKYKIRIQNMPVGAPFAIFLYSVGRNNAQIVELVSNSTSNTYYGFEVEDDSYRIEIRARAYGSFPYSFTITEIVKSIIEPIKTFSLNGRQFSSPHYYSTSFSSSNVVNLPTVSLTGANPFMGVQVSPSGRYIVETYGHNSMTYTIRVSSFINGVATTLGTTTYSGIAAFNIGQLAFNSTETKARFLDFDGNIRELNITSPAISAVTISLANKGQQLSPCGRFVRYNTNSPNFYDGIYDITTGSAVNITPSELASLSGDISNFFYLNGAAYVIYSHSGGTRVYSCESRASLYFFSPDNTGSGTVSFFGDYIWSGSLRKKVVWDLTPSTYYNASSYGTSWVHDGIVLGPGFMSGSGYPSYAVNSIIGENSSSSVRVAPWTRDYIATVVNSSTNYNTRINSVAGAYTPVTRESLHYGDITSWI